MPAPYPLQLAVAFENREGLSTVYNRAIDAAPPGAVLVFMHDDVWIEDCFFAQRIAEGLQVYDVIGIAGNKRRADRQPGWAIIDHDFTFDDPANLSGSVGHGPTPLGTISHFGPCPADCELLDGVFLAARADSLARKGVRFDERFRFHFYDLDFCRSVRQHALRVGTWPLSVTHQSKGSFGGQEWQEAYGAYLEKWGS